MKLPRVFVVAFAPLLLAHCDAPEAMGSAADAGFEVDAPDVGLCFVDYPCFGAKFRCLDGERYIEVVTHDCHHSCGPGPCSGGTCDQVGEAKRCGAGLICRPHSGMEPQAGDSPCAEPRSDAGYGSEAGAMDTGSDSGDPGDG